MKPAIETRGWGSKYYAMQAAEASRRSRGITKEDRAEDSARRASLRRQVYGTEQPYRGRVELGEFRP